MSRSKSTPYNRESAEATASRAIQSADFSSIPSSRNSNASNVPRLLPASRVSLSRATSPAIQAPTSLKLLEPAPMRSASPLQYFLIQPDLDEKLRSASRSADKIRETHGKEVRDELDQPTPSERLTLPTASWARANPRRRGCFPRSRSALKQAKSFAGFSNVRGHG
jgi:hypothetical protein